MKNQKEYQLQFIKGVGPKKAEALYKFGIKNFWDAIFFFPRSYIDRGSSVNIKTLKDKLLKQSYITENDFDNVNELSIRSEFTLLVRITGKREHNLSRGKKLLTIIASDGSGDSIRINFWNFTDFYKSKYSLGMHLLVTGSAKLNRSYPEFNHPDIEIIEESQKDGYEKGKILPIYRLSEQLRKSNISLNLIRDIVFHSFEKHKDDIFERQSQYILEKTQVQGFYDSLFGVHFPETISKLEASIKRLKFDEIFIYILKLKYGRKNISSKSVKIEGKSQSARKVYESLPFKLTKDQKSVLNQIADDLQSGKPMNRLLQGDVGSGKTITAFLAMLIAIDKGFQALFIAPTEILAEQHYNTFLKFTEKLDIEITLLTGSIKLKSKKIILEKIGSGETNIIVGTHALFQQNLQYKNLAFVVIDEQHRFGVAQRNNLKLLAENSFENEKISPHILVMSATPIPRTLSMTIYSDLEVSYIKKRPSGRLPIITTIAFESKLNEVYKFIRSEIGKGRQAYIVFPLIEKSEKVDLKAAEEQFTILSKTAFKDHSCGLLHGKLKWNEKEEIMNDFKDKKINILFSTTVVEVGVDVPNATIMVIMNAERFGLSQLHQLRGRVGRGNYQSFCILVTQDKYEIKVKRGLDKETEKISAIMRLKTMENTTDGFEIAEADLKIRGPGDMTGKKQSGLPNFNFLSLLNDEKLIFNTKKLIEEILSEDPDLSLEKNKNIKDWLEREAKREENFVETA